MAGVVPARPRADGVRLRHVHGRLWPALRAAERIGCMMIPAGSGNTERHIAMIEDYGTTVLVATPSYAMHMCEVGEQLGYDWAKSRRCAWACSAASRARRRLKAEIESRMHIVCTDNYGLTEVMGPGVSGECLGSPRSCSTSPRTTSCGRSWIPRPASLCPTARRASSCSRRSTKQAHPRAALPHARPHPRDHRAVRVRPHRWRACRRCARATDDMLIIRGTNVFPSAGGGRAGRHRRASHRTTASLWTTTDGLDRMTVSRGAQARGACSDSLRRRWMNLRQAPSTRSSRACCSWACA